MRPLSKEDREKILELKSQGVSHAEIGRRLGRNKSTIVYYIRAENNNVEPRSNIMPKEKTDEIHRLILEGKRNKEIARIIPCDHRTVSRIRCVIKEANVEKEQPNPVLEKPKITHEPNAPILESRIESLLARGLKRKEAEYWAMIDLKKRRGEKIAIRQYE